MVSYKGGTDMEAWEPGQRTINAPLGDLGDFSEVLIFELYLDR